MTDLYCTIGPASADAAVIARLERAGATLFRINLSHTALDEVEAAILRIRRATQVAICLDSEGAQVRTWAFQASQYLPDDRVITVTEEPVLGTVDRFTLTPATAVRQLRVGDPMSIDFNGVLAQVVEVGAGEARLRVLNSGSIGTNKAVTVERKLDLPAITPKDERAIEIGLGLGVRCFALSFAGSASDVRAFRRLTGMDSRIISKIESIDGFNNVEEIAAVSDGLLIDRGDLSRQVSLECIPSIQKAIIRAGHAKGRKVYVATNLLESMVSASSPTRAEVNDIWNTLMDGADGLVLAAETAIGANPVLCANVIRRVANEHRRQQVAGSINLAARSELPQPHGGRLVEQRADPEILGELERLPKLTVGLRELMDAEQIALGAYSPLTGFMDQETVASVLGRSQLPSGEAWTLPIVLQTRGLPVKAGVGDHLRLCLEEDGYTYSVLRIAGRFSADPTDLAAAWFGSASMRHPGVSRLVRGGPDFLAGAVQMVRRLPNHYGRLTLSPAQCRFVMERKGWTRVVGFHTRNVPHRAHEHLQLAALERVGADGLLINPLLGPGKRGDFAPRVVLESYKALIDSGAYPSGRAMLSGLASWPRYSGPREAVFAAIVRKNMGCTHFIVGRDHSGVGEFYGAEAAGQMFDAIGDLGIEPLTFGRVDYDLERDAYVEVPTQSSRPISGSIVREALRTRTQLPEWMVRAEVQALIHAEIDAGRRVFVA